MKSLTFLKNKEKIIYFLSAVFIAAASYIYVSDRIKERIYYGTATSTDILFLVFFIFSTMWMGVFFFYNKKVSWLRFIGVFLLTYLPAEIILIYGIQNYREFNPLIMVLAAVYIAVLALYLAVKHYAKCKLPKPATGPEKQKNIFKRLGVNNSKTALLIFALMLISFSFGYHHIGRFAAVDEPLWTEDRIPDFWKNLKHQDWYETRVSDKPGLTVAVISGIGTLWEDPIFYKNISLSSRYDLSLYDPEKLNIALRLPIFIFILLSLPFFYLLIKKISGRSAAIYSLVFIALSPILIGFSRIINPDGLIWVLMALSFLSFIAYLKEKNPVFLYSSSILLGFSLLTKYVSNILFIFYFFLIFLDYVLKNAAGSRENINAYLKKALLDYGMLVLLALSVFYVFYPAVWAKPDRVLIGTIYSQAFLPIWPYFAAILLFFLADTLILENRILSWIINNLIKIRKFLIAVMFLIFILSIAVMLANVASGMRFFDFEGILASPKSSYVQAGGLGIYFSNFYPLIFGISPFAFIFIAVYPAKIVLKKFELGENARIFFYLALFIMFYYAGSAVSHVASIIRYQMVIYPLALITGGIAVSELLKVFKFKLFNKYAALGFLLITSGIYSLWTIKPFYTDYASILLPQKYFINIKDMGSGSYEAAMFLNSIPDAKNLIIWADKKGVCTFFTGNCYSTYEPSELNQMNFDYFVLSSGRQSRTEKIVALRAKKNIIRIDKLYEIENPFHKIILGGRPNNYVKIIKAQDVVQ